MNKNKPLMRILIIALSLFLVIGLAACGGNEQEPATASSQPSAEENANTAADNSDASQAQESPSTAAKNGSNTDPFAGDLPKSMQLMLGTFYLEDTDQAVTQEQASEMLLLWKAVRSMSDSETAAQEEIDALYDQIVESMTDEQLKLLDSMEFSREDQMAFMEEHGISMRANSGDSSADGENSGGMVAPPEGFGGGQGGGQGGGRPGGEGFSAENMTPEQMETLQAAREAGMGGMNMLPPAVFDALIELLETRAAG